MTLLFIDGFDHYDDVAEKYEAGFAAGPVTDDPRTGTRHLQISASTAHATKYVVDSATLIIGVAIKLPTLNPAASGWENVFSMFDDGTRQLSVQYQESSGRFRVANGSFSSGVTAVIDLTDGYHYIELKCTFHATTGSYTFRVDESILLSGSNLDTDPAVTGVANQVRMDRAQSITRFDDLYICDALGGNNDDFLGSIQVITLYPDADGNQNDFTPLSAGANYVEVDETPHDSDTSYVYSDTNSHLDLYDVDTLSGINTIYGVQVTTVAQKTTAASADLNLMVRSGGSNYIGSTTHSLAQGSYAVYEEIWELNPNGSVSWTTAAVNAAEYGFKITV